MTKWIRADHAQAELQAAVAAEREACARIVEAHAISRARFDADDCNPRPALASAIRARTDTDAQAALERVKREAQNEALGEAAVNLRTYAPHLVDGPEHDVGYYHGYYTAVDRILNLALLGRAEKGGE